jgi:hypothetical protein
MLSSYDEFPIHQLPHPVSIVSNTDPGFDDGYYFGFFSAELKTFCFMGIRINPNTDLVGGYVAFNRAGRQRTVRFSRTWRELADTWVGPFRIQFLEPFKQIRLTLEPNESQMALDVMWYGSAPAFEEAHHWAVNRGRPTTDQTRYSQPGQVEGWIEIDGERTAVDRETWSASRDHSWGLYFSRAPMSPNPKWLPPHQPGGTPRAMRFWTIFGSGDLCGFYGFHETADGQQVKMNDTFGTPFEGALYFGWDQTVELIGARHELQFDGDKKILAAATVVLTDRDGGEWTQVLAPVTVPWVAQTMGYDKGSWTDGGSMRTYHGPGITVDWDEFDFTQQPLTHTMHDGTVLENLVGREYLMQITTTAPDGHSWTGTGQTEFFLDGPFPRYGITPERHDVRMIAADY